MNFQIFKETIDGEIKIIKNAAKSILFNQGQTWIKTKINSNENPLHDITIGNKHRVNICELVGLNLLKGMKIIINQDKLEYVETN